MKRKITAVVLTLSILLSCFIAVEYTANAATADRSGVAAVPDTYSEVTDNPYGLTDDLDNATILQAWNWSYANMTKELDKIASQGFTVIQISPPNEIKEGTTGHKVTGETDNGWWMFYQPAGFQLNQSEDNALGTKSELVALVKAAHAKGIRVIADSVINHMGTCSNEDSITSSDPMQHVTPKAKTFEPEIYDNKLFHSPWFNMTYQYEWSGPQDTCTNDLTRGCTSRLPDLKTEDSRVQNAIYEYLQEMVDCGIDGFRFDAAKHIETPSDLASYRSDFWVNTVTKVKTYAKNTYNKELLSYGEILNTCGYGRSYQHYYPFMKVTDSTIYRQVQKAVINGSASSAIPQNMANGTKAQTVLWNESHDTYMDGESKNFSKAQRNKTWAAIAARNGITSMYLARPQSLTQQLGVASETDWTAKEVAEVNKFNNVYEGTEEYLATSSNIAVVGRGTKDNHGGAVLINCSGTTTSVSNITVATMADGAYTDRVSGAQFTVANGKVSGSIGDTGVAVLYDDPGPTVSATASGKYYTDTNTIKLRCNNVDSATYEYNGSTPVAYSNGQTVTIGSSADTKGATYVVTLKGYLGGQLVCQESYTYTKAEKPTAYEVVFNPGSVWTDSTFYCYSWNASTQAASSQWPGSPMTANGDGTYSYTVSSDCDRVIFNTGNGGKQTVDITIDDSTSYTLTGQTSLNGGGTTCYTVNATPTSSTDPTYYPGQPTQPTETATSSLYEKGDVNRDKSVDIRDVTAIQKYLILLESFDNEQLALADFNANGRVNIKDATAIQYFILSANNTPAV